MRATNSTLRRVRITIIMGTAASWIALGILIFRQRHLLAVADPMSDTGISLGYGFLTRFAVPGLLGFTAIVTVTLAILERGAVKRTALGADPSKIP